MVNEVVLPLALKDAFNSLKPEQDYDIYSSDTDAGKLLASSVYTPELGTLLNALYGVPLPKYLAVLEAPSASVKVAVERLRLLCKPFG